MNIYCDHFHKSHCIQLTSLFLIASVIKFATQHFMYNHNAAGDMIGLHIDIARLIYIHVQLDGCSVDAAA